MQKRTNRLAIGLLLLVMLCSCATMPPVSQQADRERQVEIWMSVYDQQYKDTMNIMSSPLSTENQKEMGRKKTAILTEAWPLLKAYRDVVLAGGVPTESSTQAVTDVMNRLGRLAGGH